MPEDVCDEHWHGSADYSHCRIQGANLWGEYLVDPAHAVEDVADDRREEGGA